MVLPLRGVDTLRKVGAALSISAERQLHPSPTPLWGMKGARMGIGQNNERKQKMSSEGVYYGVARKTSPWSILATFTSLDAAEDWIKRQTYPEQFRVVEY